MIKPISHSLKIPNRTANIKSNINHNAGTDTVVAPARSAFCATTATCFSKGSTMTSSIPTL